MWRIAFDELAVLIEQIFHHFVGGIAGKHVAAVDAPIPLSSRSILVRKPCWSKV